MFIIIIIIIRNGAKTISLQTSFGDLIIIRNGAKKKKSPNFVWGLNKKQSKHNMSPETSFGGHNKKRSKHNKI
jgi:hypothetical protein